MAVIFSVEQAEEKVNDNTKQWNNRSAYQQVLCQIVWRQQAAVGKCAFKQLAQGYRKFGKCVQRFERINPYIIQAIRPWQNTQQVGTQRNARKR